VSDLKHTLKDRVRKMAFRTSVDQLRKRGVEKVNVLGLDRIVNLIEEAVRRSLRDHMVGLDSDRVAEDAKQEFMQLLRSNADLQRDKQELENRRREAEEQLKALRQEIDSQRQELVAKLDQPLENRAVIAAENARIVARVEEAFAALGGSASNTEAAKAQVLSVVMGLVDEERKLTADATTALRDQEVEMLQRRIAKLNSSLEVTERKLTEVASARGSTTVWPPSTARSRACAATTQRSRRSASSCRASSRPTSRCRRARRLRPTDSMGDGGPSGREGFNR